MEDVFEVALDERADLLRLQVIGVVVTGRQHIGADHDATLHFLAETGGAALFIHVGDVLAVNTQAVADAVIPSKVGRGFCRCDDVIGWKGIFGVRQRDVDHLGTGVAQPFDALGPELFDFIRHAVNAIFPRDTDLQTLQRLADGLFVIRHGKVNRGRVLGVDACHRLQEDGGIAHVAGNRASLIERRGVSHNAEARAAAVSGLDADGACEGCRLADGAAGVGCGGAGAQMRGNGCGRTARGAAGHQLLFGTIGAPRVDGRAVPGAFIGRAHGKFVHVKLAEHNGALVPEVLGDGGFVFRLETIKDVRAGLGMNITRCEKVLHAERNAFQLTRGTRSDTTIGGFRHLARLLRRCRDIGVQRAVGGVDGGEIGVGQLKGGKIFRLQLLTGFGNGQARQVGHGRQRLSKISEKSGGKMDRLFDHFRHHEEIAIGRGRIGDDIIRLVAIGDLVGALFHRDRRHGRHRLDAVDIHFRKLLHETEYAVQLAEHILCFIFGDSDTGKARNALYGGEIDGHGFTPVRIFLPAIITMSVLRNGRKYVVSHCGAVLRQRHALTELQKDKVSPAFGVWTRASAPSMPATNLSGV